MSLPRRFQDWFAARGWTPRAHQLAVLAHAEARDTVLLISPTGGGKTLAGFLPSLAEITARGPGQGIHTLYVSPLKALAVDIARNLEAPIAEMGLPVTVETRTGDTPQARRQRQRQKPPDILITTPEQVSLLVADPQAGHLLKGLRMVILDELHALVTSKRGVLLSLALTRVQSHAPEAIRIGLSATVADPDALRAWLVPAGAFGDGPTGCAAQYPHSGLGGACAMVRTFRAVCHSGSLRGNPPGKDDARLCQHALAGGGDLPGAVGGQ
jgi:ATP-dependent Lhr-like helicase